MSNNSYIEHLGTGTTDMIASCWYNITEYARDIGNIAAGYIAGSNGISWGATRIAFDYLQSRQDKRFSIEGISSRNAQYLGWCMGYYNNSPAQQSRNTFRSFKFY